MKTLRSDNKAENLYGKSLKSIEKAYLQATKKYGVETTKAIVTEDFCGLKQGAVLGFNKKGEIIFGNAFATYCGNELIVCVKVHKNDYLISDAIKVNSKAKKVEKVDKIKVGKVITINL